MRAKMSDEQCPLIEDEAALEELLSRPTPLSVEAMRQLDGDLLILGAGGKMGPSLARLARRSALQAGRSSLRIVAVSRFSNELLRLELEREGIETVRADLLDASQRQRLPQLPNVVFMTGYKFGGTAQPELYWATNTYLAGLIAEQYSRARFVVFSSGNVYPFRRLHEPAPAEESECEPVGEYAITVLGRERMFEYVSRRYGTPVCLFRLNYAVELRYGILVDLAQRIVAGEPIDLSVPEVNFIWQGHANAVALACFRLVASPPRVLNVTGRARHRVRDLAERLGHQLGLQPRFAGPEGDASLLSSANRRSAPIR